MRLIDADALRADCDKYNSWDAQIVKAWLDEQPTIGEVTESMIQQAYEEGKTIGEHSALTVMKSLFHTEPTIGAWIPCSERLPKDRKNVLVSEKATYINMKDSSTYTRYEIAIGWYVEDSEIWRRECGEESDTIECPLAWQPLPEPYKE